MHLAAAVRSPTLYQLSPDETYYLQFAKVVASGGATLTPEFAFMDPLFGYALGGLVRCFGDGIFVLMSVNVVLDSLTAILVFRIAAACRGSMTGLVAMLIYALCSTAIFYSATLLRESFVAFYLTTLVWGGLRLSNCRAAVPWIMFGLFCALGVALRSNLIIACVASTILLPMLAVAEHNVSKRFALRCAGFLLIGLSAGVGVLGLRSVAVSGTWSALPYNGGPVLHHIYNPENPGAHSIFPKFVSYAEPVEMWNGYRDEAIRRTGHPMTPHQVSNYWSTQAMAYVMANPMQTLQNVVRKAGEFLSWREIGNNRSFSDEQMFSPLLRMLPMPSGWLIALGLPGLLFAGGGSVRRTWLLVVPGIAFATFVIFYAESRFRFVAMPILAVGAALLLSTLWLSIRRSDWRTTMAPLACAVALGTASLLQSASQAAPGTNWVRLGWGSAQLGNLTQAQDWAERGLDSGNDIAKAHELLGYVALKQGRPRDAVEHLQFSVQTDGARWHVARYNLALALAQIGEFDEATEYSRSAVALSPSRDYAILYHDLLLASGHEDLATEFASVHASRLPDGGQLSRSMSLQRLARLKIVPR